MVAAAPGAKPKLVPPGVSIGQVQPHFVRIEPGLGNDDPHLAVAVAKTRLND
jgi:hypothetical protein